MEARPGGAISASTAQFYKFFDLPLEIRQLVYREWCEAWSLCVHFNRTTDRFEMTGWPDRSLLLVSKAIKAESQPYMDKAFGSKLDLKDVRVHCDGGARFRSSLDVIGTMGVDRLLERVDTITMENGTTGMLGLLPWHKFPALRRVQLEEYPKTMPLAGGKISKFWPFDTTPDKHGDYQLSGVFGYTEWTYCPTRVMQEQVRVFSVRRGFASGACLKTIVEHKADRGELVERICEDETGGWKLIMGSGGL